MFESSQFLSFYLPEYFKKVYLSANSSQSLQNSTQTDLNILAQFLKFSSKIYEQLGVKYEFSLFLMNEFDCLNSQQTNKNLNCSNLNIKKGQGIMEKIEQKVLDKFTINSIQLFLKFFKTLIDIENQSNEFYVSKKSIDETSRLLLKQMQQTRFKFEQYRMQSCPLREYDCYAKQIFEEIIESSDQINDKMRQILQCVLTDQCANINESVVDHLMKLLGPKQSEQAKQLLNSTCQNVLYNELRKNISKKTKKIEKQKGEPPKTRKRSIDSNKPQFQSPKSPRRPLNFESSPLPLHRSPTNRIKNYAKNKKQKDLDKKRTIYCQRKSMYLPKLRELFDKMTCFASQTTVSLQEKEIKKTEKKGFKFEKNLNHYEDQESENVLVRSTPKPNKKFMPNIKIISHKLDFC